MAKSEALELANFICRFGGKLVLLDLADEIVIPGFLSGGIRTYGKTNYFVYQPRLLNLSPDKNPTLVLAGRFIKDTVLEREQIFDEKRGLIPDSESIRSSPSAFFVLILNDHRLLYLRETSHAPTLSEFQSTIQRLLLERHVDFINELYEQRKAGYVDPGDERVTKKKLREEYPRPKVNVVPLATGESLEKFVRRFEVLKTLRVELVETNDEVDPDELFRGLREQKDKLASRKTSVTHNNPKGLNKDEVMSQVEPVVGQGNHRIILAGQDEEGDTLRGNNDDFRVRVPVEKIGKRVPIAARQLFEIFQRLVREGIVVAAKAARDNRDKIRALAERNDL